ncbi:MAG: hypothetical protein IKP35_02015 [Alphaproteobacteria bacterium]|nr:hypothetical protein [Alphaproteobacteria bacterium]
MMLKRNKNKRNYYIHYDIERLASVKTKEADVKELGKVQYQITVKYFVYHGRALVDSNTIKTKKMRVSGNEIFKKVATIDENIRNTKRTMVGELKRNGVDEQTMTYIMAKKGFGHDAR